MSGFQLSGIDAAPFEHLFTLSDEDLKAHAAVRRIATHDTGFPCRVSLEDAKAGEELLLLPYAHQSADSPYRASGPIFIRRNATRRTLSVGEVPPYVTRRLISLRAYDTDDMMIDAAVCEGVRVGEELTRCFANSAVEYVHLHNANRGCFSCVARRV